MFITHCCHHVVNYDRRSRYEEVRIHTVQQLLLASGDQVARFLLFLVFNSETHKTDDGKCEITYRILKLRGSELLVTYRPQRCWYPCDEVQLLQLLLLQAVLPVTGIEEHAGNRNRSFMEIKAKAKRTKQHKLRFYCVRSTNVRLLKIRGKSN